MQQRQEPFFKAKRRSAMFVCLFVVCLNPSCAVQTAAAGAHSVLRLRRLHGNAGHAQHPLKHPSVRGHPRRRGGRGQRSRGTLSSCPFRERSGVERAEGSLLKKSSWRDDKNSDAAERWPTCGRPPVAGPGTAGKPLPLHVSPSGTECCPRFYFAPEN